MRSNQRNDAPSSVLGRAWRVLGCFDDTDGGLPLSEITARSDLPKTTVYRLLCELESLDAVERSDQRWRLGMRLFELGQRVPRQLGLRDAAMPALRDLFEATHETVHLAVLDGADIVYLSKLEGRDAPRVPSRVGGRMPAYCTGLGKALLAHVGAERLHAIVAGGMPRRTPYTVHAAGLLERQLDAVRQSGVAYEQEESTIGITCVASPVLRDGRAVAAISITGWVNRLDTARVATAVRTAALGMARTLPRTVIA